jgi:hypothetical protein
MSGRTAGSGSGAQLARKTIAILEINSIENNTLLVLEHPRREPPWRKCFPDIGLHEAVVMLLLGTGFAKKVVR